MRIRTDSLVTGDAVLVSFEAQTQTEHVQSDSNTILQRKVEDLTAVRVSPPPPSHNYI
jgi:hypothetical protein